jgi:hypothetical protein
LNKNPNPSTMFKKGVTGNPLGRPAVPADLLEARKFTRLKLERVLNRMIHMTRQELSDYIKNPNIGAMELLLASILTKAISHGDYQRADFILNRLVGKVPDKIDATITNPFLGMSDEEKLEKAKEVVVVLEKKVIENKSETEASSSG